MCLYRWEHQNLVIATVVIVVVVVCLFIRIWGYKVVDTLKEETFAGRNFRGSEKFRGNKLSRWTTFKRFPGNKKRRKSKFMRRNIRFYCTVIKVGHLTCVKIAKKEFQKLVFHYSFLSWVLNFWNITNATIIWYHKYKSVFFFRIFADDDFFRKFRGKKLSRMTSFEKFRGNKLSRIWLKAAKPRKFLPAKVSSRESFFL